MQIRMNRMRFFWWLKHLMFLWVRSKVFPKNLQTDLKLDPKKPVLYVFKSRSVTDLLILDRYCVKAGLPRPHFDYSTLKGSQNGSVLFLAKSGILTQKRSKILPKPLCQLINQIREENFDIQLVPVSVFWGRNPGKEEKSLFKLMFFDDENGGLWQRFITFIVQGRNVFCNIGKPLSLQTLVAEGLSSEDTEKKLRRVLRVHYRRQKETIVGPHIYDRNQVIATILKSKAVREAMEYEAKKKNLSISKMESRASKYADEVCAKASPHALRFFDILLGWLWKKIYAGLEVKQGDKIRELSEQYELVYMPSHRSHMDYLLIGYVLYYLGLLPPHTIAGINLNFWPVGPLLRRGGGIFIRRSFGGDRLYGVVVSEFVQYLLSTGFPFCFYPEGGRSRSGFLLPPKLGILSMVVDGNKKPAKKPILLVPVYVGYDRIMEGRSYQKELRGRSKKTESIGQLVKAIKIIKSSFGKAYIGFGEPLHLKEYIEKNTKTISIKDASPKLNPIVSSLGQEMMARTNAAAVISPVAFFSLILLAAPKKALSEDDLLCFSRNLLDIFETSFKNSLIHFPKKETLTSDLIEAESLSQITRFSHPSGDILYVNESDCNLLSYYRNNIMHVFFIPSLIANYLQHNKVVQRSALLEFAQLMYKFMKKELSLPWDQNGFLNELELNIDALIKQKFLNSPDASTLAQPDVLQRERFYFRLLANIVETNLEQYTIYTHLLSRYAQIELVIRETFENDCKSTSQKLSLLNGTWDSEWFDSKKFNHFIKIMTENKYIISQENYLKVSNKSVEAANILMCMLNPDMKLSLKSSPLSSLEDFPQTDQREINEAMAPR